MQTELADAVAEAAKRQPTVEVVPEVLDGRAASVLCERSRGARIVVLGSRGLGGFTGLLVGSVSMTVASHAHCSVVVVHDGEDAQAQGKPVVVGLDDSPEAHLAVAFAAEEAAARGVGLVGMRAWSPPTAPWHTDVRPLVLDTAELETAEQHRLTAALGNWSDKYPTLRVATRLVSGDARQALTEATDDAQLVVVGRRGRGGLASLMLGSVSHYLLHHARCPVAVVRPGGPQA